MGVFDIFRSATPETLKAKGDASGLIKLLAGCQPSETAKLDEIVGALVELGERSVGPLVKALGFKHSQDEKSAVVRMSAVRALALIGKPAVAALIDALDMTNEQTKALPEWPVEALVTIGEPAVEPLIAALNRSSGDGASRVLTAIGIDPRTEAAGALGRLGDPRAVAPLTQIVEDESSGFHLRQAATKALEALKESKPPGPTPSPAGDDAKAQKGIALVEKYITMKHPAGPMDQMMGLGDSKPEYRAAPGGIARSSNIMMDGKIVSVAACLKGGSVDLADGEAVARKAMEAVQHYASLPDVKTFFLMPYHLRKGVIVEGEAIPPEEICRLYAGVENMLLQIYEDLPDGGVIDDARVAQKVRSLAESIS